MTNDGEERPEGGRFPILNSDLGKISMFRVRLSFSAELCSRERRNGSFVLDAGRRTP